MGATGGRFNLSGTLGLYLPPLCALQGRISLIPVLGSLHETLQKQQPLAE